MKLDRSQREHLADLLKDSANVVLASLVIAGFVDRTVGWLLTVAGLALYVGLVISTTRLQKGG